MKISIAMASYNGAKYLQDQLDSYSRQTRLPDELVVCDDGSVDETIDILGRYERQAPFAVRVYRNSKNLGFTQNFGKAMGLCQGDVIFLSDQDDVWFPDKLAAVEKHLISTPNCLVVINDLEIADSELNQTGLTVLGQNRSLGLGDEFFNPGCCMAFRANLKPLILSIPPQAVTHDTWINTIALSIGGRNLLAKPLQLYRRHGSNSSHWIGSRGSELHWIDQFELRPRKTVPADYSRLGDILDIIEERLIGIGPEAYQKLGAARPLADVMTRLKRERKALSQRRTLIESGWLRRKMLAIGMASRGQYAYFRGWKSFAKDMLR